MTDEIKIIPLHYAKRIEEFVKAVGRKVRVALFYRREGKKLVCFAYITDFSTGNPREDIPRFNKEVKEMGANFATIIDVTPNSRRSVITQLSRKTFSMVIPYEI